MKIPYLLSVLLFGAASTSATVTLSFSTGTVQASNFANSSGVGGTTMVWGIIIDTGGDGFEFSNGGTGYSPNFSVVAGGQSLIDGSGAASDDFLFIAPNRMTITAQANDGTVFGQNRISSVANIPYGSNGIGQGDAFAVVWFDRTDFGGAPTGFHEAYGVVTDPVFTIAADGSVIQYTSPFVGPDPLKQMTQVFVPEPSSALLGLLGAVGLLRRRRA